MKDAMPSRGGQVENAEPAIEVAHLTKIFDGVTAVDNIDFAIARGSVNTLRPRVS